MSKTRFTPGPWSVGYTTKRSYRMAPDQFEVPVHVGDAERRGNCLAIAYMGGEGAIDCRKEAVEANAHLIAAAPDMYEALKGLLDEHCCDDGSADYDGTATECSRCIPAKSAIAKAEGKGV